jgi:hypothetical protein
MPPTVATAASGADGRYRCRHGKVDNGYKCKECRGAGICACGNVREHCRTCKVQRTANFCSRSGSKKQACRCCGADFSCGKGVCKDHGYPKRNCPLCKGLLKYTGVSYQVWPLLGTSGIRFTKRAGAEALSPRELSFAAQETASHAQAEPIMCEAVQCLKDDE